MWCFPSPWSTASGKSLLPAECLSGGVPPPHHGQSRHVGPPPAGQQGGVGVPHVVPECPGGVVIQQGVDHAVGRRQTQRHHHRPLQHHRRGAVPTAADGVQVQRSNQMVRQKAEQERCRYHGNKVHRPPPVLTAGFAGHPAAREIGATCQAVDQLAVANDDGEEGEEEAEGQRHIVQDQDPFPRGEVRWLEAARKPCPGINRDSRKSMLQFTTGPSGAIIRCYHLYMCGQVVPSPHILNSLMLVYLFWVH